MKTFIASDDRTPIVYIEPFSFFAAHRTLTIVFLIVHIRVHSVLVWLLFECANNRGHLSSSSASEYVVPVLRICIRLS
ncbi:MAG: hypothetical protein J6W09_04270 [Bacteroidales bacterium]|nr:hypothetical protein [Bacteroidales bacterium]